ncbi:MAG: Translation initiation factor IF-2 [Berkelbacteria bacterium GW2011_GWA2_46_7]|uniref:Translation initiation factor IF-2 n=1 Tax=Berkelbacteria bacterium GW2011_GWA2_46_7 TaxID=1618335 RepID=A0A0G1SRB2_9BACT|nr:MAG: Translation initiation factor IF-2 [Berkelbacteria bacterium GW2011_GWA2_46_7]
MAESKVLQLPESISVRALADKIGVNATDVIGKLIKNGVMATINQSIDYDTAALLVEDFNCTAEPEVLATNIFTKSTDTKSSVARPPIVTIMGHVDHGKTSLLDFIRQSNIAGGESGGITQHISAYQIEFKTSEGSKRKITFVDTPGHEAFSALRAHGASITDLVILVVAADDGIKPQTLEALHHARTANVPVIVAINKFDLPGANIERVKQQLVEHDLAPEEWGGKTVVVPVSAKTGKGVDQLLEMVILTTDLLELKADPEASSEGIVIEANMDHLRGPIATVLIYNGTLRAGQVVVTGGTYGKIKVLEDDLGRKVITAGPATPVVIMGLKDVPIFGDRLITAPNEKVAKTMVVQTASSSKASSDENDNHLRLVLKTDVGGSLAALEDSISKLKIKDATVEILSSGIGAVNENDINLAKPAKALIIAFRSTPTKRMLDLAEKEEVELREYWVIYEALDLLTEKLKKIATPVYVRDEMGRLKILQVFSQKKGVAIAGGDVTQGVVAMADEVVAYRNKESIGTAKMTGLKIGKMAVDQAEVGEQCGVGLEGSPELEKGDVLAFVKIRVE